MPNARPHFPLAAFLVLYLPAGALALGLGHLTSAEAPGFAAAIQIVLGTLAYGLAVEGAAEWGLRHPCAAPLIDRILHLRRSRFRYAMSFGLIGAALAAGAEMSARSAGLVTAYSAGPVRIGIAVAVLFVLAWVIIGLAGGRAGLIHRALDEAMAGRRR
ncbi:MAG TPA: hypothetical protein PLI43_08665 [Albidovulum sp.]|uniref:hypothetical protein n=1 Tax=Albidovulum sp. TaxID=1872424 RepID=UPI002B5FD45C|nr:hypothetical protein [Albidovulum sp.]